jgi:hypothetical protein
VHGSLPGVWVDSLGIVTQASDVRCAVAINANFVAVFDHQTWLVARTELPDDC